MKKTARMTALLILLTFLFLPWNALAQESAKPETYYLTVDQIRTAFAGAPAIHIGLALNLLAGLNAAGDRGLWVLDLSGAEINALTLVAAMENGQLKAYLQNSLGGLPQILTAPLDSLTAMASPYLPAGTNGLQSSGSALQQNILALAKATEDPARRAALWRKALTAFEQALDLTGAGSASIELFGERRDAQTFAGEPDLAGLWAALHAVFAVDPALQACFEGIDAALAESGAGLEARFAELAGILEARGAELRIAVTEYRAGDSQVRLELSMTTIEAGGQTSTVVLTLDGDISLDRPALALTFFAEAPGSQADYAWVSLESSKAPHAAGQDGYLGLLVEVGGEVGFAGAFQIETQRTDAAEHALLSAGMTSASDAYSLTVQYDADCSIESGMPTRNGSVTVHAMQDGASLLQLSFHLLLQEAALPEGELFSTDGSIALLDVTTMDAAQTQALDEAINTLTGNTLALLFQIPGVAALLGSE